MQIIKKKNKTQQIKPSENEKVLYKEENIERNKSYQDPILYNASQRIAELNKHNREKNIHKENQNKEFNQKINHFDNKNLKDFNRKTNSISNINNAYVENDNSLIKVKFKLYQNNQQSDKIQKTLYKKMLDDQVKFFKYR